MLGFFLIVLGVILLFCAVVELVASQIDRWEDWRDWDRDRREARRDAVLQARHDIVVRQLALVLDLPPEKLIGRYDWTLNDASGESATLS